MHKPLTNLPVFGADAFAALMESWKPILARAKPGMNRVVIEWNVIKGPAVFVYPASDRPHGLDLVADGVKRANDERWADFLEFQYVPQVVEAVKKAGMTPQVICTDLRPIQIQRARLRAIAAAGHERTGATPHH